MARWVGLAIHCTYSLNTLRWLGPVVRRAMIYCDVSIGSMTATFPIALGRILIERFGKQIVKGRLDGDHPQFLFLATAR